MMEELFPSIPEYIEKKRKKKNEKEEKEKELVENTV